jgi:hypothetical protein
MSLVVAVPFGVAAAVAFGAATAVQHQAAHTGTGTADARGLVHLLRDPRWLLSIGGDTLGFALQVVALANGPVVLVQPLLVLTLPVSLFVGALLGNGAPRLRDYLSCLTIVAGLTAFFMVLGTPGPASLPPPHDFATSVLVMLLGGGACCLLVRHRGPGLRAGVYGGVAGAWFGVVGVMVNAIALEHDHNGLLALVRPSQALVPLVGVVVLGGVGLTLTQISFQIGALAASFPANKAADPVAAVLLGSVLLDERIPSGGRYLLAYGLCVAAIVWGAIRLAVAAAPTAPAAPTEGSEAAPAASGTMGADEQSRA